MTDNRPTTAPQPDGVGARRGTDIREPGQDVQPGQDVEPGQAVEPGPRLPWPRIRSTEPVHPTARRRLTARLRSALRLRPAALAVPVGYLLASLLLYVHLWADLDRRYLVDSMRDQNQWEWFFAVTAHNVLNLDNPLFTVQQNFPLGVNLMANTVMLGLSVPLAPVTALFGPTVTWALVLTGGLAGTATAWYWLIRKYLTRDRAAAVLGGAFSAFAPPMISHANAHPNLVVLFAIPLIIDRLLRLCGTPPITASPIAASPVTAPPVAASATGRVTQNAERQNAEPENAERKNAEPKNDTEPENGPEPGPEKGSPNDPEKSEAQGSEPRLRPRPLRDGIVLGLLLAWQIFLGEESLLLAATGMLVFAVAHACMRRTFARAALGPLLRGVGIATVVCLPLVAYPLYWQFSGDQSYSSILHGPTGNPPLALFEFSARALAGDVQRAAALSMNPTEQNAFYGWPLASLLLGIVVLLWDRVAVRALTWTVVVTAVLSLGVSIPLAFTDTAAPGPWWVLDKLPLFESVIESRYAMVCAPAIGMLLAVAWTAVAESARAAAAGEGTERERRNRARVMRLAAGVALTAGLLPIVPRPLETVDRPAVPQVVADGTWRSFVRPGQSLVPVPLPSPGEASALKWQIDADFGFPLPGGYFNGPAGPDRVGIYGAVPRPTNDLLRDVRYTGRVPQIGPDQQRAAREDLRFWRAGALVLASQPNDEALRITVERLLGVEGRRIGDAWVWDVG
ncbi:glycosyltransferase family 2 protein [Streptomyces sp. NPDC002055]|uniref:glycosyltransferase family 2 protein n=1 Tax=Streptomyces sp. NPDC002055 TaxID=3154534 RepID=UPI0033195817